MKIGIDIRLIGKKRTGDEVVFLNLVKNLASIDSRNEYFLFTDIEDKAKLDLISKSVDIYGKSNFQIVSLPVGRFKWNFWALQEYLRKNPVDVYHTQYITPWFVPRSIKIVTIIHDISFNFFPQFIKFSDLFFLKILIPISLQRADKIIAVSEFTKSEIEKYYKINPEKIEVVYNSVEEGFLSDVVSEEEKGNIRKKYALPEKFILYIGTLQPRKNIPMLIEAFGNAEEKLDGIRLVICGNRNAHNYDKKIDEAIQKNALENKVLFPGFIDEADKKVLFSLAHAFAFPSLYEGFGIPILEAMSQKIPVLASEIPSLKEIAGEGALYFNAGSLDDFSKKLYDVCTDIDLRVKLAIKGKTRVSFFSWENSAKKTLAIYENSYHN